MSKNTLVYTLELPSHAHAIDVINAEAFGPGRFTRAAQRIREQGGHDLGLSYVVLDGDELIASVRMTPVQVGPVKAYMLGPIVVRPHYKSYGIGAKLMALALDAAGLNGADAVILVGDPPYYSRFGFLPVAWKAIAFPGPVDPARVMVKPLQEFDQSLLAGPIHWSNWSQHLRPQQRSEKWEPVLGKIRCENNGLAPMSVPGQIFFSQTENDQADAA